jgi:hypothetical protein
MLYTRNAFYFRKYYKEKEARENGYIDLNFVGSLHPDKKRSETGFSKLIYGNREDLGKLLGTIALNVAADDQAIYELIQNADDCKSSFFSVSYNKDYLLCINNGNYFSDCDMSAIINVAGNYKDGEDIGTFGIGFKILHRLVGADDGREAIINDYAGPVIFSWNKYFQLKKFIDEEPIYISGIGKFKEKYDFERDKENPWLVKLLYTCFPSHYKEPIRLGDYETRDVKFTEEELNEMRTFLKSSLKEVNLTEENYLKNGSIFFLKLGKGKSKFLDEGIDKIKSGLSYSFNFLNNLKKIYINGEEIKVKSISKYQDGFPIGSKEFLEINPKNKERDIKFTFAFYSDYKEAADLQKGLAPNLYTFFSMDEEKNGFSFVLHCNAFDMTNDRRKLQANSQINEKLLPEIANKIIAYTNKQKENNRSLFLSLYANFLLSKIPIGKPHINNYFFKYIHDFLIKNIPTKDGYSEYPQNVKIKKLKLQLNLSDFGLNHIQWFEWDKEEDKILIEEAIKNEKLGLQEWDIRDIIENANLDSINNWIASCDDNTYTSFLNELEKSRLRDKTKAKIRQIKLFKFTNKKFYSFNDIVTSKDASEKTSFKYINCFFTCNKTKNIKSELIRLGIVVSEVTTSDYPNIFSSITLPDDKKHYELIANWCIENGGKLSPQEKKTLFLNFINEETKFDNVGESTLKNLYLFCNRNSETQILGKLIGNIETPSWLNEYKIKQEEYFPELDSYLISKSDDIFKEVYQPNQESILSNITTVEEIKALIKLYQKNQKSFFKEFIIKKDGIVFKIDKKTNETYQVQSPDKEARKFIDQHCVDNLFVLPFEFLEFKDEEGIVKADDLHNLILDFVDVNRFKELLINIVKYKAKHKFLQKLSEFRFKSNAKYTQEDFEYKILNMACAELDNDVDINEFRNKVIIETEQKNLTLAEIPPCTDRIKIGIYELNLAKILPKNYDNSKYLNGLINQFIELGLNKERVHSLFGISAKPAPNEIFQMFSDQVKILENSEQLAFVILYNNYIEKIDLSLFKVLTKGGGICDISYNFYTTYYSFLVEDAILDDKYKDIKKILGELPFSITNENQLLKEPYFTEESFICPGLVTENLSQEQKLSLINFLFDQWNKEKIKRIIKIIDWSKIKDTETENILGFNPSTSVYPSKYACECELLPDYLINWIGNDKSKVDFLTDLGVWTENSVIVELRKFLSGEINDFSNNRIAQETSLNNNESPLLNSFKWLKKSQITLKTKNQLETFKKVVEIINDNRINHSKLIIQEEFDIHELEKNSIEWEESYYKNWKKESNVSIFLYEGEIPKTISLNEIKDYVFYSFKEGNTAIDDEKNIYINRNADIKKELQKLELENGGFNFDGLWHNKLDALEKENAKLRSELEEIKNVKLSKTNVANLGAEVSTDISKNDQMEANREAKEIVREKLEKEGFKFTKGIGEYSTIDGVFKDYIEYPLVVKSYKYHDEPFKIGANEWIQLMRPNSMFWVHFGNRKLGCLKLFELIRKQDKLTISFSTENLDVEERLAKFAELLRYFKNVHFEFDIIKPSKYSIAEDLRDYRFDERKPEEDLSGDEQSLL